MSRASYLPILALVFFGAACGGQPPVQAAPPKVEVEALALPGSRVITASPDAQRELVRRVERVAGSGSEEERAGRVVQWVHEHVAFTPSRHATIDEILEDRNGNCH